MDFTADVGDKEEEDEEIAVVGLRSLVTTGAAVASLFLFSVPGSVIDDSTAGDSVDED